MNAIRGAYKRLSWIPTVCPTFIRRTLCSLSAPSVKLMVNRTTSVVCGLSGLVQVLSGGDDGVEVSIAQWLLLVDGKELGCLQEVFDLPPVDPEIGELLDLIVGDLVGLRQLLAQLLGFLLLGFVLLIGITVGVDGLSLGCWARGDPLPGWLVLGGTRTIRKWVVTSAGLGHVVAVEEVLPNGLACGLVELGIFQADVNPGLKGGIKGLNSVGGEKHDALVILQNA